jgi:cytochrome c553
MNMSRLTIACAALLLPLLAGAAGSVRSELEAALRSKPGVARGEVLFSQCVACHGPGGGGETNGSVPRIAGQHYRVVVKQLVDFRHGKRWDFRMEGMADKHHLADSQDIADVAAYVSDLDRPSDQGLGSGDNTSIGAAIYGRHCASCHGIDGVGDDARFIPRLAGQHYGYLMRQMYDAVDGRRPALPQLHATRIEPLDFAEVRAVADFISRIGAAPAHQP